MRRKHIAVRVEQPLLDEVDRLAAKCGFSRSEMIRKLLDVGISTTLDLEKVGLLRVGLSLRSFAEWVNSGKQMPLPLEGSKP